MADPKSKVQETIEKLSRLKGRLDVEIAEYTNAKTNVDENYRVSENTTKMNEAKTQISNQVALIDKVIMDAPEIRDLVGSLEGGDVETLNNAIKSVLDKVAEVKNMGIKDATGKDVTFETRTGNAVAEIEKIKGKEYTASKAPDKLEDIETKITELESTIAQEEEYKKYEGLREEVAKSASARTGGVPVDPKDVEPKDYETAYKKFTSDFSKKIEELKGYQRIEKIDVKNFRRIEERDTLKANKAKVKSLIDALKLVKGTETISINGTDIEISKLDIEKLIKEGKGNDINNAIKKLVTLANDAKKDAPTKVEDMKKDLKDSKIMVLFEADRAKLEAALNAKPVNIAELDATLGSMKDIDGPNFEKLEKMGEIDANEFAKARRELARLTTIKDAIVAEQSASSIVVEKNEITTLNIKGVNIELQKTDYTGRFIDATEPDDRTDVLKSTFEAILKSDDKTVYNELSRKIVEDSAKKNGDKLPRHIPFFSNFAAAVRGDEFTTRDKAIQKRMKRMIREEFDKRQEIAKEVETEKKKMKDEKVAEKQQDRNDAFALDEETRKKVNAAAYEAARKKALEGKKGAEVEKAFSEAGEKAEKGEDSER